MNKVYVIVSLVSIPGGHGEGSESMYQLLGAKYYGTQSEALLQVEKVRLRCMASNAEVLELDHVQ